MAAGLHAWSRRRCSMGLAEAVRAACTSAADARSFADALVSVLTLTPYDRRKMAQVAKLAELSWECQLQPLVDLICA